MSGFAGLTYVSFARSESLIKRSSLVAVSRNNCTAFFKDSGMGKVLIATYVLPSLSPCINFQVDKIQLRLGKRKHFPLPKQFESCQLTHRDSISRKFSLKCCNRLTEVLLQTFCIVTAVKRQQKTVSQSHQHIPSCPGNCLVTCETCIMESNLNLKQNRQERTDEYVLVVKDGPQ